MRWDGGGEAWNGVYWSPGWVVEEYQGETETCLLTSSSVPLHPPGMLCLFFLRLALFNVTSDTCLINMHVHRYLGLAVYIRLTYQRGANFAVPWQ